MPTDLIKGKTNKVLVSMSLPISIGMLSTFLFQVIDTYFVGQLGPNELAALSFASALYFLVVGLFIGLAVGVSIIIGNAEGANDNIKVNQTVITALLLSIISGCICSFIVAYFADPLFILLGTNANVLPLVKMYIIPLFYGIPLLTFGLMAGGILRATGNVSMPEVIMGIAGIINLLFDYLLIFGKFGFPELGIRGAAIATVLSWVFVFIGMIILLLKDGLIKVRIISQIKSILLILKEIGRLGLPTIVTQIIEPITVIYLTFLFAKESSNAVAAFGLASRIQTLLMIGILGVSSALTPFIAQNLGAKKQLRINESIAFGGRASTYLGLLVCILLFLFIKPIAGLFSDDLTVINNTAQYFYFVSISYIFYGLFIITSSIFNGLQLPMNSMKIMIIKSLAFTLPFTLTGSVFGIKGIFIGISLANILAGLYAAYEMRKEWKRTHSTLANKNIWKEYLNDFKLLLPGIRS